jgi:predicted nuclease of predicted toxin-antitoxin system
MKILIDMNLSPKWADFFTLHNIKAIHWSLIGDGRAPDEDIFDYAQRHDFIVFTSDLDFGTLLAFSKAAKSSVFQIRMDNALPYETGDKVIACLEQFKNEIKQDCLITLDDVKMRVRILPL